MQQRKKNSTALKYVPDHPIWDEMITGWPSAVVARSEIHNFTGGLITGRSVANSDSEGTGPDGRIELGNRKVGYPVRSFVQWLKSRAKTFVQETQTDD